MTENLQTPRADVDDVVLDTPDHWYELPFIGNGLAARIWASRFAKSFDRPHPRLKDQLRLTQRRLEQSDHNAGAAYVPDASRGIAALLWVDKLQGDRPDDAEAFVDDGVSVAQSNGRDLRRLRGTHAHGRLVGYGVSLDIPGDDVPPSPTRKSFVVLPVDNGLHQLIVLSMETDLPAPDGFGDVDDHLMTIAERMTLTFDGE